MSLKIKKNKFVNNRFEVGEITSLPPPNLHIVWAYEIKRKKSVHEFALKFKSIVL